MKENKCFPKGFNLQECLDFYFQVKHFFEIVWKVGKKSHFTNMASYDYFRILAPKINIKTLTFFQNLFYFRIFALKSIVKNSRFSIKISLIFKLRQIFAFSVIFIYSRFPQFSHFMQFPHISHFPISWVFCGFSGLAWKFKWEIILIRCGSGSGSTFVIVVIFVIFADLLNGSELWDTGSHGCLISQRRRLSHNLGPRLEPRGRAWRSVPYALLWHVQLFRSIRFRCGTSSQKWSVWRTCLGHSQCHGHWSLVASLGFPRQYCARSPICQGSGPEL